MKKLLAYLLVVLLAINFVACSSDDDDGPTTPSTYKVSGTITDANGNGVSNQTVEAKSTSDTKTTTTDSQGNYEFASLTAGATYTVSANGTNYYFKTSGTGEVTLNEDATVNFTAVGIYGTWVAEGTNVSLFLYQWLNARKITATFNENASYTVVTVDSAGVESTIGGTFSISKSTVDNIFTITANQTVGGNLTAEGIFEVYSDSTPFTMKYEVVQTSGQSNIPPTPEAGFGSSNGGVFGDQLIQIYTRQ